jgi:hypothetical protein
MKLLRNRIRHLLIFNFMIFGWACQKTGTVPLVAGVAAFTVVDAIPNSINNIIPIINTSQAIMWFSNANQVGYGYFFEYSPVAGSDTIFVVQSSDTVNFGPKASGLMFYGILPLKKGGIYSLFLCGADTTSPDYLFTTDTLPVYSSADSVMGIRFVNLSTGSNPISVNLEGNSNGSEVTSLSYKAVTPFKQYANNSTTQDYLFVFREAATGDSLTQFDFVLNGGGNYGFGLTDPVTGDLLTFKNITIAFYGSASNFNYPLNTMEVDDY